MVFIMDRIRRFFWLLVTQLFYVFRFKSIGERTRIIKPLQLNAVNSIALEDHVFIAEGAWLMGNKLLKQTMLIKKGTTIGHFAHLIATHSVIIEERVLIADRVFITDCMHNYENINIPVKEQGLRQLKAVTIGEGSWLGENVCVCGSNIGKHCVIGANSVVLNDVPDYCVAVGIPAKVVKRFDFEKQAWLPTNQVY